MIMMLCSASPLLSVVPPPRSLSDTEPALTAGMLSACNTPEPGALYPQLKLQYWCIHTHNFPFAVAELQTQQWQPGLEKDGDDA